MAGRLDEFLLELGPTRGLVVTPGGQVVDIVEVTHALAEQKAGPTVQ